MATIEIDTIQKLIDFSEGVYGRGNSSEYLDVVLTVDLDFNDLAENNIPYNWAGCTGSWYVNFNGQGHTIDNIVYIGTNEWGFFNTLYGGKVENIYLTNIHVISTEHIAGVVIYKNSNPTLQNIHISGQLETINTNNEVPACGFYFQGEGSVSQCSFSGVIKSNGSAFGIGQNGNTLVTDCMINADITAPIYTAPFTSTNATIINSEFRGTVTGGTLMVGAYSANLTNCLLIYQPGTTGSWQSNSSYYNVCFDSTLAAEGGFDLSGFITPATTAELKDKTWLINKGFTIYDGELIETYSGNLAPNGPNTYGSSSNAYLYTTTDWQFTINRVSAKSSLSQQQLEDGVDSYVNLIVTTSNGGSVSQRIDMTTTDRQYYDVNLSINIPAYNWVHLDAQYVSANVYWNHSNTLVAGGWTGSNTTTPSQIGFFDVDFTIDYVNVWNIDNQNEGYVRIAAYNAEEFTGFSKDKYGYPKNKSVWKLDGQNEGYPWITGFKTIVNDLTNYKIYDSELNELKLYDNELNELNLYKI